MGTSVTSQRGSCCGVPGPAYGRKPREDLAVRSGRANAQAGETVAELSQVERDKRLAGRALERSAQVRVSLSGWRRLHGVLRGPGSFPARGSRH